MPMANRRRSPSRENHVRPVGRIGFGSSVALGECHRHWPVANARGSDGRVIPSPRHPLRPAL